MLKSLLIGLFSFLSFSVYAEDFVQRVNLFGPAGIDIVQGTSHWTTILDQQVAVNPLNLMYWNHNGNCSVMPITILSVRYVGDKVWYATDSTDKGYYHAEPDRAIEAVKLDLYQNKVVKETCVVSIEGTVSK